jgi:TetR/AcrR family fatty acid metabolism transcriptional regulator
MPRALSRRSVLTPDLRRQQILDAATWVFARQGYRHAAVSDIITRADVARGTFYLYFDSKEQVFQSIVEDFHGRVKRAFEALDDAAHAARNNGARAILQASLRQWLEFFAAHRDATRVILREAGAIDPRFEQGFNDLRQAALTRFASRFRRFQELGFARPSIDPRLAAHVQLGMFDELLNAFVLRDGQADLNALAAQLADFEWNGIRPDRKE